MFYTLLLTVHRLFLPLTLYCWEFEGNKSFSRTFYPLVFMRCGGRGMGVKKEGSLTSLRKDLASRWLSRQLCLLRMTGQFFLYWNTQHTSTHHHTHKITSYWRRCRILPTSESRDRDKERKRIFDHEIFNLRKVRHRTSSTCQRII